MPNQKNKSRLDFMLHVVTPLFIAGGVFCAYLLMTTFWGCVVTQFWVETPATILSAELIVSRGPKSDTYRIHATYNYTYDGYSHHGTKVTPYRGNDSDNDSYARRIHQELLHYQESGESFRCFVNPMNPSKGSLSRFPRVVFLVFAHRNPAVLWSGIWITHWQHFIESAKTSRNRSDRETSR